jgi:hypothetical protein
MADLITWPVIITALIVVALISVLFGAIVALRRGEMRKALGLPPDTKLGEAEKHIFQAFEDTDLRLVRRNPNLSKARRQILAREMLRKKGLLPTETRRVR